MESTSPEILLRIDNTKIFTVENDSKQLLAAGELKILHIGDQCLYILRIDEFSYTLSKELTVLEIEKFKYAFPNVEGYLEINFTEDSDQIELEVFEMLIGTHTTFAKLSEMRSYENSPINQEEQKFPDFDETDYNQNIILNQNFIDVSEGSPVNQDNNRNAKQIIEEGANKIKSGIIKGAYFASEGLKQGGEFLKGKLGPEKIQEYKAKAQLAVFMTKIMANQAQNAAKNFISNINTTEIRQNIENSESYQNARDIGRSSATAASSIYEGLENAIQILREAGSVAINDLRNNQFESNPRVEDENQQ